TLHKNHDPTNPTCPYRTASQQIVSMTTVTELDIAAAPTSWPKDKRDDLIAQLINQYAAVLGTILITPGGAVNLPWDFLKLHEVYANPAVSPDAEHRFIALLTAEGAIAQVITTNWDPLTEKAFRGLTIALPMSGI